MNLFETFCRFTPDATHSYGAQWTRDFAYVCSFAFITIYFHPLPRILAKGLRSSQARVTTVVVPLSAIYPVYTSINHVVHAIKDHNPLKV